MKLKTNLKKKNNLTNITRQGNRWPYVFGLLVFHSHTETCAFTQINLVLLRYRVNFWKTFTSWTSLAVPTILSPLTWKDAFTRGASGVTEDSAMEKPMMKCNRGTRNSLELDKLSNVRTIEAPFLVISEPHNICAIFWADFLNCRNQLTILCQ